MLANAPVKSEVQRRQAVTAKLKLRLRPWPSAGKYSGPACSDPIMSAETRPTTTVLNIGPNRRTLA